MFNTHIKRPDKLKSSVIQVNLPFISKNFGDRTEKCSIALALKLLY